jgi:hypothetical protein
MCQKCANGVSIHMVHLCVSSMSNVCNMAYQHTRSRSNNLESTHKFKFNSELVDGKIPSVFVNDPH